MSRLVGNRGVIFELNQPIVASTPGWILQLGVPTMRYDNAFVTHPGQSAIDTDYCWHCSHYICWYPYPELTEWSSSQALIWLTVLASTNLVGACSIHWQLWGMFLCVNNISVVLCLKLFILYQQVCYSLIVMEEVAQFSFTTLLSIFNIWSGCVFCVGR